MAASPATNASHSRLSAQSIFISSFSRTEGGRTDGRGRKAAGAGWGRRNVKDGESMWRSKGWMCGWFIKKGEGREGQKLPPGELFKNEKKVTPGPGRWICVSGGGGAGVFFVLLGAAFLTGRVKYGNMAKITSSFRAVLYGSSLTRNVWRRGFTSPRRAASCHPFWLNSCEFCLSKWYPIMSCHWHPPTRALLDWAFN